MAGWHYDISISIEIGHPSYILFHFCSSFERVPWQRRRRSSSRRISVTRPLPCISRLCCKRLPIRSISIPHAASYLQLKNLTLFDSGFELPHAWGHMPQRQTKPSHQPTAFAQSYEGSQHPSPKEFECKISDPPQTLYIYTTYTCHIMVVFKHTVYMTYFFAWIFKTMAAEIHLRQ